MVNYGEDKLNTLLAGLFELVLMMYTKKIDTFNKNQLRLKIEELEKVIDDLKKQDGVVASCPVSSTYLYHEKARYS